MQQLTQILGRQTVGAVTPDDLRAVFGRLGRQQSNRVSSLRRKIGTVKGLLRHRCAKEATPHNPSAELLYPPLVVSEQLPVTPGEVDAIIQAAASPGWRALIVRLVDAGLKRDEAVALRCEDVELIDGADGPGRRHIRHRRASKQVKQRTLATISRRSSRASPRSSRQMQRP